MKKNNSLPDLTGRFAVCADCGNTISSSYDLAFFEYNGSNKDVPKKLLEEFGSLLKKGWDAGYSGCHNPKDPKTFPKELDGEVNRARQAINKARKHDQYYCGCRGWD